MAPAEMLHPPTQEESLSRGNRRVRLAAGVKALMRGPTASDYCDMSYSLWCRLNAAGKTPRPIKIGGGQGTATWWSRSAIDKWVELGCPPRAELEAALRDQEATR